MVELANSFEGGTPSASITTGNSGGSSGDAFDTVSVSGSATFVYDSDTVEGSVAGLATVAATGSAQVGWNSSLGSATTRWFRMYFKFDTSLPGSNSVIAKGEDSGGQAWDIQVTSGGALRWRAPFSTRYTASTTLSADTWYRLEWRIDDSVSAGHFAARLYAGANVHGSTPDESWGDLIDGWDTGSGLVDVRFGRISAANATAAFDALGVSETDWIGSADPPPTVVDATVTSEPADVLFDAPTSFSSITRTLFTWPAGAAWDGAPATIHTTTVIVPATIVTEPADWLTDGAAAAVDAETNITVTSEPADVLFDVGGDTTVDSDVELPVANAGRLLLLGVG